MQFGKVDQPELIDFKLPEDHLQTSVILGAGKQKLECFVGCAKWNKTDLKNFYPKGVKEELEYYSTQFNSIELNATFYNMPSGEQVKVWKDKTPEGFKFFPKITNSVSHFRRLKEVKKVVDDFCDAVGKFEEKLGMVFLQLHDNFKPKDFDRLEKFVKEFPKGIPLAIEVRNGEWFSDAKVAEDYHQLLTQHNVSNIIVDTAGRRDLLHMRLTTTNAFVRYVGANHDSDYQRLEDWVVRIKQWQSQGLEHLYFFVHQNIELKSPLLSAFFIEKLNKELKIDLAVPQLLEPFVKASSSKKATTKKG